jgi:hypothetical protein
VDSRQQSYTEVLEAHMVSYDCFEFDSFDPMDYDRIEHRTLENAQIPCTTVAKSTFTLAELRERDKLSPSESYTGSAGSASWETDSGDFFGVTHDEEDVIPLPSLTMGRTSLEENHFSWAQTFGSQK